MHGQSKMTDEGPRPSLEKDHKFLMERQEKGGVAGISS